MKQATLVPFVRHDLDILFVGLNPAEGSSRKGHYFSVNQAFWNQLFDASLITKRVDKLVADQVVFGGTEVNCNHWQYGITDLLPSIAESDSRKVRPTKDDCCMLVNTIEKFAPRTVVLVHSKVVKHLCRHLGIRQFPTNCGGVGSIINKVKTKFFCIAFPHGNTIFAREKVEKYSELRQFLGATEQD